MTPVWLFWQLAPLPGMLFLLAQWKVIDEDFEKLEAKRKQTRVFQMDSRIFIRILAWHFLFIFPLYSFDLVMRFFLTREWKKLQGCFITRSTYFADATLGAPNDDNNRSRNTIRGIESSQQYNTQRQAAKEEISERLIGRRRNTQRETRAQRQRNKKTKNNKTRATFHAFVRLALAA